MFISGISLFFSMQESYDSPTTSIQCWHVYCEECWLRTLVGKTSVDIKHSPINCTVMLNTGLIKRPTGDACLYS